LLDIDTGPTPNPIPEEPSEQWFAQPASARARRAIAINFPMGGIIVPNGIRIKPD
jgi:hypothetical protein